MAIITKITRILFRHNCLLCRQSADDVVCESGITCLFASMNSKKHQVELDSQYDYYYMFEYCDEIKYLLKRFKFQKDLLVADVLIKLINMWWDSFAVNHLSDVDAIAVVPIHRYRYLYRGFNQSEVLMQGLSYHIFKPTTFDRYKRVKYAKAQAKSSKKSRISNIDGAFEMTKTIRVKHLLVFDDVLTTGSTLKEFIKTINPRGNIEKISIVTLVRA